MKLRLLISLLLVLCLTSAWAEKFALVGATVINPADGKTFPNAILVIDGNKISSLRPKAEPQSGIKTIDCTGKFILPGYIDTHVHFFQSGDIYTRPDAADLTSIRSYADEHAW